jgi:hypothetical protein
MDWVAVSAIAGVFTAVFVALTAVYLSIQIKSSAQATQSQTYHLATSALAEMAAIVGRDKDLSRTFRIGMVNPEALSEDDFTQFVYLGTSLFRRYENVFFQYQSGMIDEDFWIGRRDNLLWFFHRPGMQVWWKDRKYGFSKRFREFLDKSTDSDITSPETRRL